MTITANEPFFTWSDAWVFTALYYTVKNEQIIDWAEIIPTGDALNHAIFSADELKTAFVKLQKRGIIRISENGIGLTDFGRTLVEKTEKVRGGWFSRVDIALGKLNSKRSNLPFCIDIHDCGFITDKKITESLKNITRQSYQRGKTNETKSLHRKRP